ncbi:hypothetical protein [Dictyobacter formicarum]|uniref:Uncharacterized protein n=1 Tax=Dictyobacter formicarum TaxID=2778368 RepID=A0ABQ3VRB7_9CHLR|nr:hypothetical protein [Dictyobacter formicarum]GHO88239.1 hypothetical protein KSZ_62450 [Dictyobacter formicarum]
MMTQVAPPISVTPRDKDETRILDRIASNYRNATIAFLSTDNVNENGIQFHLQPGDGGSQPPRITTTGFAFEDDGERDHLTPLQRLRLHFYCTLSRSEGGRR